MSITCTVCGTVNPDGTTYCEGCGVELSPQHAAAPATSTATDTTPAAAHVDGDLTPPAATPVAESPAVQTPDSHELAAGIPDMPLTGTPDATTASPADVTATEASLPETSAPADTTPGSPDVTETAPVAAAVAAPPTPAPSDAPAKLGIKKYGAPTGEFIPLHGERLVVGRFDASSGPVDIDLTGLGGQEHISRRHAELYREHGVWTVRDLGSTNGVYVKRAGESAFSPRVQEPTALGDGDEVAFGNLMLTFHQG